MTDVTEKAREKFEKLAPKWMSFDVELSYAQNIVNTAQDRDKKYYLKDRMAAHPAEFWGALMNVAATGLSLNPAKREGYIILRRGQMMFDPSYIGMCRLATDTGVIRLVHADRVHENDGFRLPSFDEKPTFADERGHNPFAKERGELLGYYCTIKTKHGDYKTSVFEMEDINKINEGIVWKTWPHEMGNKAAIRRGYKTWPLSDGDREAVQRLAEAVHIGDLNEGLTNPVSAPEIGSYDQETKDRLDKCITENDKAGIVLLKSEVSATVWANLHNSFPKGEITKYKNLMNDLELTGEAMVNDYVNLINESDTYEIDDYLSELDEMGLVDLVKERVYAEAAHYISTEWNKAS